MEPRFVDLDAFWVMGVQVHAMPDEVDFAAFWDEQFMPHLDALQALSTDEACYGVWFPHSEDGIPDYVAGMAVPEGSPVVEGLVARQVPASRYAVFDCSLEGIGRTYGHVYNTWLPESDYEFPEGCADFEYYPPEGVEEASPAVYIPIRVKA